MKRHKLAVAAHLMLLNERNELLLLRRRGTGYMDGWWSIPAGHLDPGETLHATCTRETMEEIAVELTTDALQLRCIQQKLDLDGDERIDAFFSAALPPGAQPRIIEPEKCDGLRWASPLPLGDQLVPYVAHAIEHIFSGGGPLAYFGYEGDPQLGS
jgi:8-oxo-dGTP diphosphatase